MTKYNISIIMPIYNGEKFIEKTVHSIINKNNNLKLDIILINDCSCDNSELICKKLESKYKYIRYFSNKENQGIAYTRNVGLINAKGEYITFVDQDDDVIEGYYNFIRILENNNCDFIVTDCYTRKNNKYFKQHNITENILCNKEIINDIEKYILCWNGFDRKYPKIKMGCSVWNCIFKNEFIKKNKISFKSIISYEDDWLFIIDCLDSANNIYLSKDSYYCWNYNKKSESHINKYISDSYNKGKLIKNYTLDKTYKLNVTNKEINKIIDINDLGLIISFFNYESFNPNSNEYINNMINICEEILDDVNYKRLKNVAKERDKIILYFLKKKQYALAKAMNIMYIKTRYLIRNIVNSIS